MDMIPTTSLKHKRTSHSIHHTYLNRYGIECSRVNCTCEGATDDEARSMYDAHIRFAENAWASGKRWNGSAVRIIGITLRDAAGTVLAEWKRPVESVVAA